MHAILDVLFQRDKIVFYVTSRRKSNGLSSGKWGGQNIGSPFLLQFTGNWAVSVSSTLPKYEIVAPCWNIMLAHAHVVKKDIF
jgi:hypothetical protein